MQDVFLGKKIIVGISGGIAAYKSCILIRELIKRGAEVKVITTDSALKFITPLTLSAISKNPVITGIFPDEDPNAKNTWHIEMAMWADLMIVAPATVNTVAKIAAGFADNALTTLVLALRSPLILSPAADVDMYENIITRRNLEFLEDAGYYIVEAESGFLASGLEGKGRLPEINKIVDAAEIVLSGYKKDLTAKKIVVTAGPTFEDIDAVRYLGNRSSGKMGYAIAKSAYLRGANVTLISGPGAQESYPEIKTVKVRSAAEMRDSVRKEICENEVLIMSAAVADYTPVKTAGNKIKKEDGLTSIPLKETEDILASVEKDGKKVVGFALETDNEIENAKKKLEKKNLDMIVLNSLNDKDSGFEFDTNSATIIFRNGTVKKIDICTKFQMANKILDEIKEIL